MLQRATAGQFFKGDLEFAMDRVLWPRRKLKSVRIRVATVRPHRAASIAERTARVPRIVRRLRATAGMRECAAGETVGATG